MATYRFVAWLDEVGTVIATEPTIDLLIERDLTITAQYEETVPVYQLTLAPDKTDYYTIENILLSGFLTTDGTPVPGVNVTLYRNDTPHLITTTQADGSYLFEDNVPVAGYVEYFAEYVVAELIFRSNSLVIRRPR